MRSIFPQTPFAFSAGLKGRGPRSSTAAFACLLAEYMSQSQGCQGKKRKTAKMARRCCWQHMQICRGLRAGADPRRALGAAEKFRAFLKKSRRRPRQGAKAPGRRSARAPKRQGAEARGGYSSARSRSARAPKRQGAEARGGYSSARSRSARKKTKMPSDRKNAQNGSGRCSFFLRAADGTAGNAETFAAEAE